GDVFAQIGASVLRPLHIRSARFLLPAQFTAYVRDASLIVAHAGMGSILTALEFGKSILIMPRHGDLGETRNDHQVSTARRFAARDQITVAFDADELAQRLDQLAIGPIAAISSKPPISRWAPPELITNLRGFIEANAPRIGNSTHE